MTQLEREYFSTFTLERLKALYRAVAKEANFGIYEYYVDPEDGYNGLSYVTRKWLRPGGKVVEIKLNKRKIRQAIEEREKSLGNDYRG